MSTDGDESGASVQAMLKDDGKSESEPEPDTDEDTAVSTPPGDQNEAEDVDNAKAEIIKALRNPTGTWRPYAAENCSTRKVGVKSSKTQGKKQTHQSSQSKGKGKRRRSPSPHPARFMTAGDLHWLGFMDDNDSPDVSLASSSSSSFSSSTAPSSASSASSSSPSKRIRFNPSEDNPDVVYEWIHDDRSDEPLLPWRHDDVGKTRADGPGLFPARRLSNGEVQIQYFPKFWSPCWRLSLRRAASAPVCPGYCQQAVFP
ncbi:hypothetical protein CF328_g8268 [Tilletia controversa]|nr:hypothetical protein CF328_g8268 [Tilletia controversa]